MRVDVQKGCGMGLVPFCRPFVNVYQRLVTLRTFVPVLKFDLMLIYEGFFLKKCDLFQLFQFAKSELEQVLPVFTRHF